MGRERIYISPPQVGSLEKRLLQEALDSNWIAPLGPFVDRFEKEFAQAVEIPHAVAVSSGSSALHLALRLAGVVPGDTVLCSTLTFIAPAACVVQLGGEPIFIDSDERTWNINPSLVEETLRRTAAAGRLPRALIAVHLYGLTCDLSPLVEVCDRYGVTLIEDAAESLGATYRGRAAGTFGAIGCFSFNGNKVITASGGGMLVAWDERITERARYLATQARDPAPHYEHSELGYNYAMSNLVAAVGVAQLSGLNERITARRKVFETYQTELGSFPGVTFMPEPEGFFSTHWLTVLTIDTDLFGASALEIRKALAAHNIESRPLWKPMHLQPVFRDTKVVGGDVARELFEKGLCLPSGFSLTPDEQGKIIEIVRSCRRA